MIRFSSQTWIRPVLLGVSHLFTLLFQSCLMNMINFYLLKGQSEFLHVKQKQLPCPKCPCAFWLIAGQVTQQYK